MKSNKYNRIKVNITTYKEDFNQELDMDGDRKVEDKKNNKKKFNNFVCSICLNTKQENNTDKRNSKSCPICQLTCDVCIENNRHKDKLKKCDDKDLGKKDTASKSVQTVQTDLNKSMNLLNEVLTVFQSKKIEQVKSKTVTLKDASVSTHDVKAKLSLSKVFNISIDQNRTNEDEKFVVMSSKVDDKKVNLDHLINKSSSVPQMKLEQLKYSLKEKTKSKDIVEEVNRMFATVTKDYKRDDLNRPSIRNGSRILPVVIDMALDKERLKDNDTKITGANCKCYQTNMSSGDSIKCCHAKEITQCCHREIKKSDKAQCCHITEGRCEKCVYMMCCHYKKSRKLEAGVMICQRCSGKDSSWRNSDHSCEDIA